MLITWKDPGTSFTTKMTDNTKMMDRIICLLKKFLIKVSLYRGLGQYHGVRKPYPDPHWPCLFRCVYIVYNLDRSSSIDL